MGVFFCVWWVVVNDRDFGLGMVSGVHWGDELPVIWIWLVFGSSFYWWTTVFRVLASFRAFILLMNYRFSGLSYFSVVHNWWTTSFRGLASFRAFISPMRWTTVLQGCTQLRSFIPLMNYRFSGLSLILVVHTRWTTKIQDLAPFRAFISAMNYRFARLHSVSVVHTTNELPFFEFHLLFRRSFLKTL